MIRTPVIVASNQHPGLISSVTSANVVPDVPVEANMAASSANQPTTFRFMELAVGQSPGRCHVDGTIKANNSCSSLQRFS